MTETIIQQLIIKMSGMTPTDWTDLMDLMSDGMSFELLVNESTKERTRRLISKLYGSEVFYDELVTKSLNEPDIFGEHSDHFFAIATGQYDMLDELTGERRIATIVYNIRGNLDLRNSIGMPKRRLI